MPFTKMQGAGNDFVVIDGVSRAVSLTPEQVRRLADRRFGVGCDQVLVVEPARASGADFGYRIFNADGGEVEQCGNGARCFVRFVRDKGLTAKDEIVVDTRGGRIHPRVSPDGGVSVNMGVPRFLPSEVPFVADTPALVYPLEVEGGAYEVSVLSVGNPHAVMLVPDVDTAPVATLGPRIEHHVRFPNRVNVGFLEIRSATRARLRVWERGVGETLACGSGACAAVVAGRRLGRLGDTVEVAVRGGTLSVAWAGEGEPVWLTGPATTVFEGTIEL
nr:diaminopimelate epimerase [Sulfurifustis variabilis]